MLEKTPTIEEYIELCSKMPDTIIDCVVGNGNLNKRLVEYFKGIIDKIHC